MALTTLYQKPMQTMWIIQPAVMMPCNPSTIFTGYPGRYYMVVDTYTKADGTGGKPDKYKLFVKFSDLYRK